MKTLLTFLPLTVGIDCAISFLFSTFSLLISKSIRGSIYSARHLLFVFFFLILFTCFGILTAAFTNSDIEVAIQIHNEFRLDYKVPTNLTWSKNLADVAQRYADTLQCGQLQHSSLEGCGENLYWAGGSGQFEVKDGLNSWADELRLNQPGTKGHATQMLWADSVLVGCGLYTEGCMTLVCNYYPPGNWGGSTYLDVTEHCVAVKNEPEVAITDTCKDLKKELLDCSGQATPPETADTETGTNYDVEEGEEAGGGEGDEKQETVDSENDPPLTTDTSEVTDTMALDLFSTLLCQLQKLMHSSSTIDPDVLEPTATAEEEEKDEVSKKWVESDDTTSTTDEFMTQTRTSSFFTSTDTSTSTNDKFLLTLDTTQFPITPTETSGISSQTSFQTSTETSALGEHVKEFNTFIKPPKAMEENQLLSLSSDTSKTNDTSDISDEESGGFACHVNTLTYFGMMFVLYSFV